MSGAVAGPVIGQVTGLAIHPVKSTAIRPVGSATVLPWGLAGDRRWMVVDNIGRLVSARELRSLFHIVADTPETEQNLTRLRLSSPGLDPIEVDEPDSDLVAVQLHSSSLLGRPAPPEANDWLQRATGRSDVRLVWCDDPTRRTFERDWAAPTDHAPYTDSCPLTLASMASLHQLNDWITQGALERGEQPGDPLLMERFRPNVVIDGKDPFAEDGWTEIQIGDIGFRRPKRVDRCVMTTIDPITLTSAKEPIRTLARHRLAHQATWFAIHLIPLGTGAISLGDPVRVL